MCPTSLVPGAAVVKGLNTLSAWALQNGVLAGKQVRQKAEFSGALKKADLMEVKQPPGGRGFPKRCLDPQRSKKITSPSTR